ncbi:hypothetical protein ASG35_20400 [Burkholderia sp. Leaf177]|uniref:PAAR domain-containing protein n=1 Tax=Burkholderia sp. Leaf177 TaxID=1736287 RepID=UPI0006F94533|nr:PAAR domain-containing protein [Burkholderia sp. Leaf177]KQR74153.1 hypothetical protein ASG35_20400 [Burkholderia sp. Leaf177]
MKKPVCEGDDTSHGGKVKSASSAFNLNGRKAAVKGDIVSCPEHGDNPIVEDGPGFSFHGRNLVVDGCRTQCGSVVIARNPGVTIA